MPGGGWTAGARYTASTRMASASAYETKIGDELNAARRGMAGQGSSWQDLAGHGVARRDKARQGSSSMNEREPRREVREITSIGEWLDWRREDITASRISALFDLNPYLTRTDLAAIMRGSTSSGSRQCARRPAMRRGHVWSRPSPAAIAEERPEWKLAKATTYHRLPDLRLGCTPDYWVGDSGLIQIKTISPNQWEAWHGHPPVAYTIQTLTELLVTGRTWGVLAVMVCSPSYPVHYFDVPRHAAAERKILDAVAEWWRAWDEGEIAGAAPSVEIAADLDDGSYRDLSGDNELPVLLDERANLKATVSAADKRLKEIDYTIKNCLGPASTAWLPGWDISFKAQERKEFTVAAATIRVLRVKATKEIEDAQDNGK
jgi:predicted phage-related endonuclease